MDITFTYNEEDGGLGAETVVLSAYCHDTEEAEDLVDEIQSIAGSNLERDEDFVYVAVSIDQLDEAIEELESHGVTVLETP